MIVPAPGSRLRKLANPFDLVVLAGAAVNVIVILTLVGYWLLYG